MVLTDDNFASIVAAIREGRGIFDNIQKALAYLLAGNTSELLAMLVAVAIGLPLPLLPLHLLWINLVTETFPALALVIDPTDEDVLSRPPREVGRPILGRREWISILATAAIQAIVMLSVYVYALRTRNVDEARSIAFTALVLGDLFRAFAARSATRLFWEVGIFTNLRLLGVIFFLASVQIAILFIPLTQRLFRIGAQTASDAFLCIGAGLVAVTILELAKVVRRSITR